MTNRESNHPSDYTSPMQSWSQPVRNDEVFQSKKSFYDKGPKNFKQSDERIREVIGDALFRDLSVDAGEIEVAVRNGEVTLSGIVEKHQMKRLAEDCIKNVAGIIEIKNEIRIRQTGLQEMQKPQNTSTNKLI